MLLPVDGKEPGTGTAMDAGEISGAAGCRWGTCRGASAGVGRAKAGGDGERLSKKRFCRNRPSQSQETPINLQSRNTGSTQTVGTTPERNSS